MIKKISIAVLVVLFALIIFLVELDDINYDSKNYYIDNALEEVHSKNIVTGIYLDYRLFDSIFEAGILLVSVAGVIFMAREDKSMMKEKK